MLVEMQKIILHYMFLLHIDFFIYTVIIFSMHDEQFSKTRQQFFNTHDFF